MNNIESTIDARLTTASEISSAVAILGLGAGIQAAVEYSKTEDRTIVNKTNTFTIPDSKNVWICQQEINLDMYRHDDVIDVKILDSELIVKFEKC